ncbi:G2/mitotic-specific cyclin-B3 [Dissophora ornata]|nr:G2/mitotic-specific cyclin-B3 [Dissophora ornata]
MSMIADLDLSGADNAAQERGEDDEGGFFSIDVSGTLVCDEGENTAVQTPIKKKGTQRTPLTDISCSSVVQVSLGAKPLGPLMTRQPRKGSTRQRLIIVNPFPMSPSYWEEYANDTFMYLLEIELAFGASASVLRLSLCHHSSILFQGRYDRYMYMDPDSESTSHRTTLVLWLVEVCYKYLEYQPTTLHAADRYLSIHKMEQVPLSELQCVGMCALMIAAKLEEHTDNKCSIADLCKLCDLYTPQEITSMELSMLVVLKFEILVASAIGFSDYFQRAVPANPMLSELTDAMWIALCALHDNWSEELAILTGYSRLDLTPCTMAFKELICSSTYTLEQLAPLGLKYPLEQTLATLTPVLQM